MAHNGVGNGGPTEAGEDMAGVHVAVLEGGTGRPVLFLHGAGGAGEWTPLHARLAQSYHVIAPTHPGFGRSEDLPNLSSVRDFALFYLELLDRRGLDSLVVVGHSLGGWIAAEMAVWQPQRFSKLVLVSAAGLRREGVAQPDLFAQSLVPAGAVGDSLLSNPEALERRIRDRATMARVAWNPYIHDPHLPDRLYRLRMPTLLVWGDQDPLIPPAIGERWAELLPDTRLRLVAGAGHPVHREQPDEVARLIEEFLGR